MKKILLMMLVFFSANALGMDSAKKDADDGVVLVVANVDSIRLENLDGLSGLSSALNKYSVLIDQIRIIHGFDFNHPKKIKLTLYANDLYEIKSDKRSAFLLRILKNGGYEVIAWRPIRQFVCLPSEVVEKKYKDNYWNDFWANDGKEKCVFVNSRIDSMFDEEEGAQSR